MNNSFASLLRGSRLASFDRSIAQVYTTPRKFKANGDWGLKRNLPTVIRTSNITITDLDTNEHQTPFSSANSQVLFVKRWKENFPSSTKPSARHDSIQHPIVQMTPAEFTRFLKLCSKKQAEFQALLKKKELVRDQVYEFLNVSLSTSLDPMVGPTYSEFTSDTVLAVEGRILNSFKNGHAVGIGGVVAFLPKRHSLNLRQLGDRRVRTFYVESASIDEEGKPKVLLTMQPPSQSNFPFVFEEQPEEAKLKAPQMFLTRRRPQKVEEDNVKPHPNHIDLMKRIQDLIHK